MDPLFKASDGSIYRLISARILCQKVVWNGNRVIDPTHVERIREGLKGDISLLNSNPFRVALIKDEDGNEMHYTIAKKDLLKYTKRHVPHILCGK